MGQTADQTAIEAELASDLPDAADEYWTVKLSLVHSILLRVGIHVDRLLTRARNPESSRADPMQHARGTAASVSQHVFGR